MISMIYLSLVNLTLGPRGAGAGVPPAPPTNGLWPTLCAGRAPDPWLHRPGPIGGQHSHQKVPFQ